jgi:SagB-type dehydrogenase family enzyme
MVQQRMALAILAVCILAVGCVRDEAGMSPSSTAEAETRIALPSPQTDGELSLEEALARRRSLRELSDEELSQAEIGQLLWAGQGVTDEQGRRTAPSAGALYPLELYAVTPKGVYHYLPDDHAIELIAEGDARPRLRAAAYAQAPVGEAPLVVVVAAVPARTEEKYGPERATRYVQLEAGHAAQNMLLQAAALGLGGVPIGAFADAAVADVVGLSEGELPLYLIPIGHPR